jgi:hypothetical protein
MVNRVRKIRREVEQARRGSRADIARELSLAITALEDAEMRLTRALVRQSKHAADGDRAVDTLWEQLLADEDIPEDEPDTQEVTK